MKIYCLTVKNTNISCKTFNSMIEFVGEVKSPKHMCNQCLASGFLFNFTVQSKTKSEIN